MSTMLHNGWIYGRSGLTRSWKQPTPPRWKVQHYISNGHPICGKRWTAIAVFRGEWPKDKCSRCIGRLKAARMYLLVPAPDHLGRSGTPW